MVCLLLCTIGAQVDISEGCPSMDNGSAPLLLEGYYYDTLLPVDSA